MEIAGVEWKNNSVYVDGVKKELNNDDFIMISEERLQNSLNFAINVIKHRIEHCKKNLALHKNEAKFNEYEAFWKNGHFSLPVYKKMVEFVENPPKQWRDIDNFMSQQIVRGAINEPSSQEREDAFNIATEILLCYRG